METTLLIIAALSDALGFAWRAMVWFMAGLWLIQNVHTF